MLYRFYYFSLVLSLIACGSTRLPKKSDKPMAPAPGQFGQFSLAETLEPMPGLTIYKYVHQKAGLDVLIIPQPGTGVVGYVTAYMVGSRNEMAGRTGLAHLFEHMMFRGTKSYPEPFKTLSEWGDQANAFTAFDLTLYHELVPKVVFPEAVKFEAERMRALNITKEGFNTERGAVVSERKMRTEDSPFGRLYWDLHQLAFDVHPYKTEPIGWQEDLDATTYEDALAFYKKYYAPNRAKIAIVGDFSTAEVLAELDKNYGSFKAESWQEPKIPAEPVHKKSRRKVIHIKTENAYVAIAIRGTTYADPSNAADAFYCTLLADSKMGLLAREMIDTGVARKVSADCSPSVDPGLHVIYLVGVPGVSAQKLESTFNSARKKFAGWVTHDRIEKIKNYFIAEQYESLRNPIDMAQNLAEASATAGDPIYEFKFLEKIKKVQLNEVLGADKKWNQATDTRVIIEPSSKTDPIKRNK